MSEESKVIAEAEIQVEEPEETKVLKNVSDQDFINQRSKAPEEEESVNQTEPTKEVQEETIDESNVLSKINLDDLSEEEIEELGQKLGKGAVKRFGKLTAMRKQAEEENKTLKQKLQKLQSDKSPNVSQRDLVDNPYKDIKTPEGLSKKAEEVNQIIEWAEDILDSADDYRANDVVTEQNGKQLTKAEIRKIKKNAQKSKEKYIPQQNQYLKQATQARILEKALEEKTRKEISWSTNQESEVFKKHQQMINDRRLVDALSAADPSLKAQMNHIMAHAANSMYGRKLVDPPQSTNSNTKTLNPPKSVNPAAAAPSRSRNNRSKIISEKKKAFNTSNGNLDSFIKLRTEQLSR